MAISNFTNISKTDLAKNGELAESSLLLNRIALRTKGYQVEGLNKKRKQPSKENYSDALSDNLDNNNNQGSEFEQHPELPFMGGKADQIILPESEADAVPESQLSQAQRTQRADKRKREQEKNREELANRKKFKFTAPPPKQAPKYQPKERPRSAPPKLRPPGS